MDIKQLTGQPPQFVNMLFMKIEDIA